MYMANGGVAPPQIAKGFWVFFSKKNLFLRSADI
jgi:hypothetical protein